MLSTSTSSESSDYYSSSDIEDDYENSMDILISFEQDHSCTEEIDDDLQTKGFQPYSSLIQIVHENDFSDEILIRSWVILREFLNRTGLKCLDQSIILSLVSIVIKLVENSDHWSLSLLNHHRSIANENLICNVLDWDVDLPTPLRSVEQILYTIENISTRNSAQQLTHQLIVSCLTDSRCFDQSYVAIGIGCARLACELVHHCPITWPNFHLKSQNEHIFMKFQKSDDLIREILLEKIFGESSN